jgi:hypothetical protein
MCSVSVRTTVNLLTEKENTTGNSIQLLGAYASSTKITYFEVLKKFDNFFLHVHTHHICAFVQFSEKTIFFYVCKKRKNILWK